MSSDAARAGRDSFHTPEDDPLLWSLEKNHPWYEDLAQTSRDLLCLHDLEGRLISVNPAPALLLGYGVEELLGMSMRDLICPEFRPQFDEYLKTIAHEGEAHGLLAVLTRSGERRIWEFHNMLRTEGVSAPVVRGVAYDVTEQKRTEWELRKSEERYRSLIAALAEGVILVGAEGRLIASNQSAERIVGVKPEKLAGTITSMKDWEPYTIHEDGAPFLAAEYPAMVTLRTGQPQTNVCMGVRQGEGGVRWILINSQPLCSKGESKPYAAVASFTDITERKQADEALRRSEAELKEAQRVGQVGSWRIDIQSGAMTWSEEVYRMVGLDVAQPTPFFEELQRHLTPQGWAQVKKTYQERLENGSGPEIEVEFHRVDGTTGWVMLRGDVERDASGKVTGLYGAAVDITGRKQAERALRDSEERLRLAQSVAKMGVFERNFQTGESGWMPEMEELYGLPRGGFPKTIDAFLDLVHPEDRAQVKRCLEQSNRTGEGKGEWRVVWPDGTVHWIAGRWRVFRDQEGRPLRAIGIDYDITERKQAEEALERSERRFRTVYERSPIGICIVDTKTGQFLQVNQKFCEIAGRTEEDLAGRSFCSITHPDDFAESRELGLRMAAGDIDHYEVVKRYVRPDGSARWVQVAVVRLRDGGEHHTPGMGIVQDITERREAAELLRQSEERFRVALAGSPIQVYNQDRDLRYTWVYNLPSGSAESDYLGKSEEEVYGPDIGAQLKALKLPALDRGERVREEITLLRDGKRRHCDLSVEPLRNLAGKVVGVNTSCIDVTHLRELMEELRLAKERLSEEKLYLEQEIDTELGFEEIVGQSVALREVMEKVGKVAPSDATVLLFGETGTGKELVARALHRLSTRAGNSFIKMNCAAIPSGLLESELFGHEKGAFTGAVARKIGRLELADRGTLFLDEIGEIPLMVQPKLLRVLQDMEFERLGGTQTLKVNFRLIAATNRDLAESVRENEFRSDLYYRLNVFPIRVPPLRERRDDIRLLVEHFVQKFSRRMNKAITSIPRKTIDTLMQWDWPGNVRELENFIERSVILTHGSVLVSPLSELGPSPQISVNETLAAAEREHILRALRESHGKISGPRGAAERLGLKRTTLQSKLKQMGIDRRGDVEGD